jgi:myosin heavy subunit
MKALASNKQSAKRLSRKQSNRMNVDIVTGKEIVCLYFDPDKAIDCNLDDDWLGKNLFVPASIVKDNGDNIFTLRLPNSELVKMRNSDVSQVTEQDNEGVDDILSLKAFSQMSLLNTLRVRYARNEIYTFVGPILIAINPYKRLGDIYDESNMIDYHGRKQVQWKY